MIGSELGEVIPLVLCAALVVHFVVFALLLPELKRRNAPLGAPWKYLLASVAGDATIAAAIASHFGVKPLVPVAVGAGIGGLLGTGLARIVARERALRARLAELTQR